MVNSFDSYSSLTFSDCFHFMLSLVHTDLLSFNACFRSGFRTFSFSVGYFYSKIIYFNFSICCNFNEFSFVLRFFYFKCHSICQMSLTLLFFHELPLLLVQLFASISIYNDKDSSANNNEFDSLYSLLSIHWKKKINHYHLWSRQKATLTLKK